jgi:hypothetical protein
MSEVALVNMQTEMSFIHYAVRSPPLQVEQQLCRGLGGAPFDGSMRNGLAHRQGKPFDEGDLDRA